MRFPLPAKVVDETCKIGEEAAQCRYLARDEHAENFYCMKTDKERAEIISAEVEAHLRRNRENKKANTLPCGDNCGGYQVT